MRSVSRNRLQLREQAAGAEGIYYFFTHAKGKHTLILAARDSVPERISGYDRVPFYPPEDGGIRERDHISDWSVLQEVRSGSCALRDFDFEKPRGIWRAAGETRASMR